jgi:hypothetical protein
VSELQIWQDSEAHGPRFLPGHFMLDLRQNNGAGHTIIVAFSICTNRDRALHFAQEARHKARTLRNANAWVVDRLAGCAYLAFSFWKEILLAI